MPRRVRHEERQNPIIRRNRAKSIRCRIEPQAAATTICAFGYTSGKRSAHESIRQVFVRKFVRALREFDPVPLEMVGTLTGVVEPERVNRNHAGILPSVLVLAGLDVGRQ